ncbi:alpha/beta fold hydrolase [Methanoculleus sp. UBA303]|jgi:hypothetical protein|uniref:alpha/beta fold hydrolase n=1 Tax=Methanoculleus sp. UBA303 TaxID=1915497 RepID=UPI0025FCB581|nr:hypothetical protein [Methanoculleus sp. UBA303]MDD3932671.1 hypothetical protein [Methanoculleus sp.]
MAAAHTIPREFADEDYVLEPSRFENLNAPIMLLQGENSPEHLRASTEAVHAALPNSRIIGIPRQQHVAMSTAPELFVHLVTGFSDGAGLTMSGYVDPDGFKRARILGPFSGTSFCIPHIFCSFFPL